jgi:hypothetical protein
MLYQVLDEGVSHSVTPLWCAAVSGRLRKRQQSNILSAVAEEISSPRKPQGEGGKISWWRFR